MNLAIAGFALTAFLVLAGWIWAAATLATQLKHLSEAVEKLTNVVDRVDERVDDHETRISVLEHQRWPV